jgi:hypothetical protein
MNKIQLMLGLQRKWEVFCGEILCRQFFFCGETTLIVKYLQQAMNVENVVTKWQSRLL